MARIFEFPNSQRTSESLPEVQTSLGKYLKRYEWRYGRDAYWFFVTKSQRLPTREEADGLGRLLGHSVRSVGKNNYSKHKRISSKAALSQGQRMRRAAVEEAQKIIEFVEFFSGTTSPAPLLKSRLMKSANEDIANQSRSAISWLIALIEELTTNEEISQRSVEGRNSGDRCGKGS